MPKAFDPEMNGGRQLDLLDLVVAAEPEPARVAGPAPGPTTVVCLKGRRGDPSIADVLYVGRPMYQGGWKLAGHLLANPYRVGRDGTPEQVVARYEQWLDQHADLVARELPKLRGRRLGCWCAEGQPCHARVLARRADEGAR
ncbi:DUF4326 domain-containing protein [Streptomyces sp. WMMB303]|uniref:DUF4326 domain-containing protein n=1 Tax=Streptomyces sp. WMMB303 TaxID=3034154 RepID=UPI0023EC225A|nr:DUF4326 domain-containing protein [Streptomyces sp. WMMB303]MDF4254656.1 DUF4326 domain-containing protein [Streptomyces sp. WMMB303]MDF4254693.1 DUF4326 domain-containing protein [Streptomyces sp. WMMB303]